MNFKIELSKGKMMVMALIIILAIIDVFFFVEWVIARNEIKTIKDKVSIIQINTKVLQFSRLLTDTVLGGSKEVSFDDRLKLENAVRDLNDKEIFSAWQKFTNSTVGSDSQKSFTDLLKLLFKKISY